MKMAKKSKGRGWHGEPRRHSLARMGINTVLPDGRKLAVNKFVAAGKMDPKLFHEHEMKYRHLDEAPAHPDQLGGDRELVGLVLEHFDSYHCQNSGRVSFDIVGERRMRVFADHLYQSGDFLRFYMGGNLCAEVPFSQGKHIGWDRESKTNTTPSGGVI